jgi:hypothetical protein
LYASIFGSKKIVLEGDAAERPLTPDFPSVVDGSPINPLATRFLPGGYRHNDLAAVTFFTHSLYREEVIIF